MKKISLFSTRKGQFEAWVIYESDLSQDAKSLFTALYLNPSKIVPLQQELKQHSSINSSTKIRRAMKELELRGVVNLEGGIVLMDKVDKAPEGEVVKMIPKIVPTNEDQKAFEVFYKDEFFKRFKEPYAMFYGKDNKAIKFLIATYGLEGAKAKALTAFNFSSPNSAEERYFRNNSKSISSLVTICSKLVNIQIANQQISQAGKWHGRKSAEVKL